MTPRVVSTEGSGEWAGLAGTADDQVQNASGNPVSLLEIADYEIAYIAQGRIFW